jgi:hypothetical protein
MHAKWGKKRPFCLQNRPFVAEKRPFFGVKVDWIINRKKSELVDNSRLATKTMQNTGGFPQGGVGVQQGTGNRDQGTEGLRDRGRARLDKVFMD